uniref:Chromosomal region from 76.0 to 81.5 minutes n=1 Tax=Escherichia coli TaxID=562 RepID=O65942_ECOLX|nr:hypothetical protein [Escherichia coli str. K-12 substr. MG1655]
MPLHFLDIHALQRLCRAGFNTGRSRLPMPAQIALNRPRLFARRNDLHRTKRASQHTAFTANATCLFNENMPMFAAYRVNRARHSRTVHLHTDDRLLPWSSSGL